MITFRACPGIIICFYLPITPLLQICSAATYAMFSNPERTCLILKNQPCNRYCVFFDCNPCQTQILPRWKMILQHWHVHYMNVYHHWTHHISVTLIYPATPPKTLTPGLGKYGLKALWCDHLHCWMRKATLRFRSQRLSFIFGIARRRHRKFFRH